VFEDGTIYKEHIGFSDGGEVALEKEILSLIAHNTDDTKDKEVQLIPNELEESLEKK
jgi:hypothetical protein